MEKHRSQREKVKLHQREIEEHFEHLEEILENKPAATASTSRTTKYNTLGEIAKDSVSEKFQDHIHEITKVEVLSRSDEREIIHRFRGIVGMTLKQARSELAPHGYDIHTLYVGMGDKRPRQNYSPNVLGVRVSANQDTMNIFTGEPNENAVISEIIDVGGVDIRNYGKIRL